MFVCAPRGVNLWETSEYTNTDSWVGRVGNNNTDKTAQTTLSIRYSTYIHWGGGKAGKAANGTKRPKGSTMGQRLAPWVPPLCTVPEAKKVAI